MHKWLPYWLLPYVRTGWQCIDSPRGALVLFAGVSRRSVAFSCTKLSINSSSMPYSSIVYYLLGLVSQALHGVLLVYKYLLTRGISYSASVHSLFPVRRAQNMLWGFPGVAWRSLVPKYLFYECCKCQLGGVFPVGCAHIYLLLGFPSVTWRCVALRFAFSRTGLSSCGPPCPRLDVFLAITGTVRACVDSDRKTRPLLRLRTP